MGEFLYSVGGFILAIGILVTVHEFGHFWVARVLGVKVLRFSIGFGRPLWSRRGRNNETEYVIALVPLGGYVKMLDENESDVPAADLPRAFNRQSLWKRVAIVVAGPAFNFLFAIVAYWIVFTTGIDGVRPVIGAVESGSIAERIGFQAGDEIVTVDARPNRTWGEHRLYLFNRAFGDKSVTLETRDAGGRVKQFSVDLAQIPSESLDAAVYETGLGLSPYVPALPALVGRVVEGSPGEQAGLQRHDRILSLDDQPVQNWDDLVVQVRKHPGQSVNLIVQRGEKNLSLDIIPEAITVDGERFGRIGVERVELQIPDEMRTTIRFGPLEALWRGAEATWVMSALTVRMLAKMVKLEVSTKNISGPITIAQYAGQTVQIGLEQFLMFLAVISISLGILNLLPIPVLDGGHLLYYAIEAVKGSPMSKNALMWGQQVGFVLLAALMSLAFYNDIVRFFQ